MVLLSGEPGIGKSRLTVALQEHLKGEPHTRMRYFCSPQHTDSAFYPVIAQLERAAAFERHDLPESKLEKIVWLLGSSAEQRTDVQLLAELLSIPIGNRYPGLDWSPQRKKEKTFEALLRQLDIRSRQQPVLLVYEDVHWIDPSSRELLDMTVDRVARLPVLLLITFRPEFVPPWTGQAHLTTLTLSRLGRREGALLVERLAAPACQRIRTGERRTRYTSDPGLAWASLDPAYRALYRAVADKVQGLLALIEVLILYALVIIAVSTYGTVITQRLAMFDDLQSCQAAAQAQVATQQVLHTADVHWRCEPAW